MQLKRRLPVVAPQNEYVFFAPPGALGSLTVTSRLPTSHPLVRILWEQTVEPLEVNRRRIDVVHSPVNVSPLLLRPASVVTVHDLAFRKFPHLFPPGKRLYLSWMVRASVLRADRVIADSRSSRRDLIEEFQVEPEKVTVVPLGVDESYHPDPELATPLPHPYVLYVGTLEPRKNLPLLLRAFADLKNAGYPHKLAIVGPPGWMYRNVYELISSLGIAEAVILAGFVEDLRPWYNHADLFVYPSIFEGFGLPPLEAMACGTPVVTSSAGSLREVVDDAALVVPPNDQMTLFIAMRSILDDAGLAARLSNAGPERAARFSWDETARRTVQVYEEAARPVRSPE